MDYRDAPIALLHRSIDSEIMEFLRIAWGNEATCTAASLAHATGYPAATIRTRLTALVRDGRVAVSSDDRGRRRYRPAGGA